MNNAATTVLVTGGSGFIGSHVVHRLLLQGYTVRTTVRSLSKSDQVRKQVIPVDQPSLADRLSFYEVNLLGDEGWNEATKGVKYLLHVASPFPAGSPKDENDLIKPAVEGTLRALRHAQSNAVKRVVITSSVAAIAYGLPDYSITIDETCWTDTTKPIGAYIKSKTLAEKAAWDFVKSHPEIELSTVNPVLVTGPLLPGTKDIGTSIDIVRRIANGGLPAAPFMNLGLVDVRDVADMHIKAMELPAAKGERFMAINEGGKFWSLQELGQFLGKRIYTLPDFVIKIGAMFSTDLANLKTEVGVLKQATNKKAREVLGIDFIGTEKTLMDTVESLKQEGKL